MTVEIAILNKSAVALAADSKVTFGTKTYDTANKLFTLSKCHPVGVMIYGNAEFMGVPWETLIKSYRAQLRDACYDTVAEYAEDFIDHVLATGLFSDARHQEDYAVEMLSASMREVRMEFFGSIQRQPTKDLAEGRKRLRDIFAKRVEDIESEPDLEFARNFDVDSVRRLYGKQIDSVLEAELEGLLTEKGREYADRYSRLILVKDRLSALRSGLVVAGFGDKEVFPSLVSYQIDGVIAGYLRYKLGNACDLDRQGTHCAIVPFAQSSMADRFIQGIDPTYRDFLAGLLSSAIREAVEKVLDTAAPSAAASEDSRKKAREIVFASIREMIDSAAAYQRQHFISPIVDMVTMLPKEELAELAEALVNLTSLKQRVSSERESVGGPIDVAVISKGDGFVWIRRKHYFGAELNPAFFQNYFRSVE